MALAPDGSVWVIEPDGSILVIRESTMRSIAVAPVYDQTGRCSDEILCLLQEAKDSDIWIGTANSGLYSFKPGKHGSLIHIVGHPATEGHRIESIATLPGNRLLLSCFAEGLFVYNIASGTIEPFTITSGKLEEDILYGSRPVRLHKNQDGTILILARHVFSYNPASGRITKAEMPPSAQESPISPVSGSNGRFFLQQQQSDRLESRRGEIRNPAPQFRSGQVQQRIRRQ